MTGAVPLPLRCAEGNTEAPGLAVILPVKAALYPRLRQVLFSVQALGILRLASISR
jgi:hypothetical protein